MQFDLPLSPADEAFRREVRGFLDANSPGELKSAATDSNGDEADGFELLRRWQARLHEANLLAIAWPSEYGGRDATLIQQLIYNHEMALHGAPEPINRSAIIHTGPTIIRWGSNWQKRRFLPKMLSAEEIWCQGFSEPDAGSDLASLRTLAEVDGDSFLITGHKVWTTRAHIADWCFLLARSDPFVPKHQGISCFLVDMKSVGVTVRPIKQISGDSGFNQVSLDKVRVPKECMVGELNGGWRVATTTLSFERAGQGSTTRVERRLHLVTRLAKETLVDGTPRLKDPVVSERLAHHAVIVEALRQMSSKGLVSILEGTAGAESSVAKLLTSEIDQALSELSLDLLGPYAALVRGSPAAVKNGNVPLAYLLVRAATIGGGTSEMQRNLIAERLLGLPRDPSRE
jgi:alkylation response protein AidB-like acyl-CoA dehydrogenase